MDIFYRGYNRRRGQEYMFLFWFDFPFFCIREEWYQKHWRSICRKRTWLIGTDTGICNFPAIK